MLSVVAVSSASAGRRKDGRIASMEGIGAGDGRRTAPFTAPVGPGDGTIAVGVKYLCTHALYCGFAAM